MRSADRDVPSCQERYTCLCRFKGFIAYQIDSYLWVETCAYRHFPDQASHLRHYGDANVSRPFVFPQVVPVFLCSAAVIPLKPTFFLANLQEAGPDLMWVIAVTTRRTGLLEAAVAIG